MKDTEQAIIDSAIMIFNEDLSAPLEKVAEQAQTTRRTLHRYFKDRNELMHRCRKEIRKSCYIAMTRAYNSSEDPKVKLENMFYAGMECGTKHAFLHKLHTLHDHTHEAENQDCSEYDNTFQIWKSHLKFLQENGFISGDLSIDWIHNLYNGVISASISLQKPTIPDNQASLKQFAWYSFSRGIGM